MPMDFSRIESVIDVARMQAAHVTLVGSAPLLAADLVRSALGALTLIDPQTVDASNVARQDFPMSAVGQAKVATVAESLLRINGAVRVNGHAIDFCTLADDAIDAMLGHTNLLIAATDHFPAQARVNEIAVRRGIPALWVGLYQGARAGEIVLWHAAIDSCFRCLCSKRYEVHARAVQAGRSVDPPSVGADIFAIHLLDAIAGQLAVGLLTRGADNRFGRLIDQLGTGADARNFLQVKIDPTYTYAGRDVIRHELRIPEVCPAYFSWNTIARRDNIIFQSGCRDCALYRGHYWTPAGKGPLARVKPGPGYDEQEAARQRAIYQQDASFFKAA